jgi:hypothetical protein
VLQLLHRVVKESLMVRMSLFDLLRLNEARLQCASGVNTPSYASNFNWTGVSLHVKLFFVLLLA